MTNFKFKEKELMMELCSEIVSRLEEKADYSVTQIREYEERGIDTLGTWEEIQYNDCKRYPWLLTALSTTWRSSFELLRVGLHNNKKKGEVAL